MVGIGIGSSTNLLPIWGSGAIAFTLASLYANGKNGAAYDPSDLSTLWQDTAGTMPVTADGQSVARRDDKSGNGHHQTQATSSLRPVYKTDGVLHWLESDGVDDKLSGAVTFPASASAFMAMRSSDTSYTLAFSNASASIYYGMAVDGNVGSPQNGSGLPSYHADNGSALAPVERNTLHDAWSLGLTDVIAEARGLAVTWGANFSIFGGAGSFFYAGRCYGYVIADTTVLTASKRADLYTWLAEKQGREL